MARFKLDPVLKVRQIQEKKYKRDLTEIKVIRENAEKLLEDLEMEKNKQIETMEIEEKSEWLNYKFNMLTLTQSLNKLKSKKMRLRKF